MKPNFYEKFDKMEPYKTMNFDPINMKPSAEDLLINLVASVKNLRYDKPVDEK